MFERKKRRKILEETTQNNNKRFCELLTPWSPRRKVDNRSRTTTGVGLGVGVDVGVGVGVDVGVGPGPGDDGGYHGDVGEYSTNSTEYFNVYLWSETDGWFPR